MRSVQAFEGQHEVIALTMLLMAAAPDAPDPVTAALTTGCDAWLARRPAEQALAAAGWAKMQAGMFGVQDADGITTVALEMPAGAAGPRVCTVTWRAKQAPVAIGGPLAAARGWLHRSFPTAARTRGDLFSVNGVTMTRETWQTDRRLVLIAVAQSHPEQGMDLLVRAAGE